MALCSITGDYFKKFKLILECQLQFTGIRQKFAIKVPFVGIFWNLLLHTEFSLSGPQEAKWKYLSVGENVYMNVPSSQKYL